MTCYEALMRSHNLSKFQFSSYKMGVSVDCWVIAGLAETLVLCGTKSPWVISLWLPLFCWVSQGPSTAGAGYPDLLRGKDPLSHGSSHPWSLPMLSHPAILFGSLLQPQYISPRMCSCSHSQALCLRVFILAALLISKWVTSSCVLSLNNSTSVRPSPSIKSDNKIRIAILSTHPILIFP